MRHWLLYLHQAIEVAGSYANMFIFRAILLRTLPGHPNPDRAWRTTWWRYWAGPNWNFRQTRPNKFPYTQWWVFKLPPQEVASVSLVFDEVIFHQHRFSPFRKAVPYCDHQ